MNLKEAIELIDPVIRIKLRLYNDSSSPKILGELQGRLSQMKREVIWLELIKTGIMQISDCYKENINRIEALNILIKHLEEVLK